MYKVSINYTSKELKAKDRIRVKDTSDALPINMLCEDSPLIVTVDYFAVLKIECEKIKNGVANTLIVVDTSGNKFTTSSESAIRAISDIYDEILDDEELANNPFDVKFYMKPSNNYKGKNFITCSLV